MDTIGDCAINTDCFELGGIVDMKGEPFPFFQPIVDVSRLTVAGYEALARSRDDDGAVISLGPVFSDPSIDRNTLREIDRSIRRQAIERLSACSDDTFLSLNISPEWMHYVGVGDAVPTIEMVREAGLDPQRIVIEIVESSGDHTSMQRLLDRYRQEGMRIAIDDFGAGHSDMRRLVALEPDIIKLDMMLLKRAMAGGVLQDVLHSISQLAQRNGCDLLCEGVENEEELRFALDHGARFLQGYYLWQPQAELIDADEPAARLNPFLRQYMDDKVHVERVRQRFTEGVEQYLIALCSLIEEGRIALGALPTTPQGLIRFYICRTDGFQESPNYEPRSGVGAGGGEGVGAKAEDTWRVDPSTIGHNRCSRPYFHQVLARIKPQMSPVRSSIYRDIASGQLCQTLGVMVSDNRILFADFSYFSDQQLAELEV
ncbi:EAL domain-containing protein [Spongiibacter nanhainus]|uniref:EAL domain-containing protein n=1 Tax=Spongiibacter nanhainus TaxID=2794344 RepID=A0A7T4QYB7_9GAMM|nr:EAL domain-containing protein [Spongiibacter nanhainus]QQD16932.1 EAL domain-containing protein [Spongiibacter nanhainus]